MRMLMLNIGHRWPITKSVIPVAVALILIVIAVVTMFPISRVVEAQGETDLVTFPTGEIEFIIGPQLRSGSSYNPVPWFDQNEAAKGIEFGEAFPANPPGGSPIPG